MLEPIDKGTDLLYGDKGPTPRQAEFRDNPSRYKLYGGAVGGGKSLALCAESLRLLLAYPGNRGFLCRHESTAFKMTTLATLLTLIGKIEDILHQKLVSNHHRTDKIIYFLNGSSLLYGALGDLSDMERIKSLEIGFFGIDEASETEFENYKMLKSRLRWKLPNGEYPPFTGLLASNPEPGWVKRTFVTPQRAGSPLPRHAFIQALPRDNPHLPSDYLADLVETNPADWVKKYIEGSWDALKGQVYPQFSYETHAIEPFPIPYEWTRFRAIDHGQVAPTACLWFAVDPDSNLYVYREYYSPGVISSHCSTIRELSLGEDYIATYLPPECWGKTMEKDSRLWSILEEYADHGIYCSKANNSLHAGINRVAEHFHVNPTRPNPRTGQLGSPSLFIFKTCTNLLTELPDYIWLEQSSDSTDKERTRKRDDHACFDDKTEVLTEKGWFKFTELPRGVKVATMNKSWGLEYQEPTDYIEYDYDGLLITYKSPKKTVDFAVTPNHKMLVVSQANAKKWKTHLLEKVEAQDLDKVTQWWVPKQSIPEDRPFYGVISPKLLGLYLAEGSKSITRGRKYIHLDNNDKRLLDEILNHTGLSGSVSPANGRCWRLSIRSDELYNLLSTTGDYCYNKRIPRWFLENASVEELKECYKYMILGDGSYTKGTEVYNSTSLGLCDDVVELLIRIGRTGYIYKVTDAGVTRVIQGRETSNAANCYRVYASAPGYKERYNTIQTKYLDLEYYKGKVYCVTVPNGTLCTRRYERVTWIGNCDALRYGVMSRPSPATTTKVVPANSFESTRKRYQRARKLAASGTGSIHTVYDLITRKVIS